MPFYEQSDQSSPSFDGSKCVFAASPVQQHRDSMILVISGDSSTLHPITFISLHPGITSIPRTSEISQGYFC